MLKRALAAVVLIVLTAGFAPKEPSPEPEPDAGKLQGTWDLTAVTLGGKNAPVIGGRKLTVRFTRTGCVMDAAGQQKQDLTFKVNDAKKPAWIDLTRGNETVKGIYEVKGDTLRMCYGVAGPKAARPTGFDAMKGEMAVMTFKRAKTKK